MVESMLPAIMSNALIACGIGLIAWSGSRFYRRPSLWHTVWLLAILKVFLPPIWSVPATLLSERLPDTVPMVVSNVNANVVRSDFETVELTPSLVPSETTEASTSMGIPEAGPWSLANVSWGLAIGSLWALGSLVVFSASTYRIARFHALVRRSTAADPATDALVDSTAASLCDSGTRPHVRLVDQVIPPLLWPIGRTPTIVLPLRWWKTTTPSERSTVVMHELVHWRRADHWVRLLQWIASILFWWHPLVWIARGELHRLEEQCCDAEVMHRLPGAGRAYASALLSASQWLDDADKLSLPRCKPSLLAMPMSRITPFESFQERIQMLPTLQYRPWTRRHMAAMLFATAVPLAIGLSASGQQNTASELNPTSRIDDAKRATLTGIVTDLADKPIADAKVRVVIPSTDLRFDVDATAHREVWGKTDASGNYSIDISGIEQETVASIDILHREHRRLVGTLTRGGYPNDVTLSPGGRAEFNATLPESLYFAGQVVDEAGMPIEGILVGSSLRTPKSDAGIERSKTDAEGHFAVYSYEAAFLKGDTPLGDKTAVLWFQHDRYIDADIEKLEDLDPSKRDTLRVVMRAGYSISGTVNGADGTPASDVAISITQKEPDQRKAVRTDEQGQFRFDGINGGSAHLRVVDVVGNKKSIQTLDVDASRTEMIVSLVPFETAVTTTRQVLGMTLTDLTDAIDEAFDLGYATDKGVMVVEPGNQSEGFEIGEVRPGDVFWMVGNDRVASLRAMVNQLVKEARSPTIPRGAPGNLSAYVENDGNARVRVVYGFDDDRGHGSNTQYLKLTQQDIAELEELLESLESADRI